MHRAAFASYGVSPSPSFCPSRFVIGRQMAVYSVRWRGKYFDWYPSLGTRRGKRHGAHVDFTSKHPVSLSLACVAQQVTVGLTVVFYEWLARGIRQLRKRQLYQKGKKQKRKKKKKKKKKKEKGVLLVLRQYKWFFLWSRPYHVPPCKADTPKFSRLEARGCKMPSSLRSERAISFFFLSLQPPSQWKQNQERGNNIRRARAR